jgi:hypothetical protein
VLFFAMLRYYIRYGYMSSPALSPHLDAGLVRRYIVKLESVVQASLSTKKKAERVALGLSTRVLGSLGRQSKHNLSDLTRHSQHPAVFW